MRDLDLAAALSAGRQAVEEYVVQCQRQGNEWYEVPATEFLCTAAYPRLEPIKFTQHEEGVIGADWLWWWVDRTGECFGLLVQAKKLWRRGERWFIDFRYPRNTGEQMASLFAAASFLDVAPAYMLYGGDVGYRSDLPCGRGHSGPDCKRCQKACVSVIGALSARTVVNLSALSYPGTSAVDVFRRASPLEDLADPLMSPDLILDMNLRHVDADLRDFLRVQQGGARQVAKSLLRQVSELRIGQFAAMQAEQLSADASMVFEHLPADAGHFGIPYFAHTLSGLRRGLPYYVTDLARGGHPPAWLTDRAVGVMLVHI